MENNDLEKKVEIKIELPFNNLFLNAGFVSGDNGLVKYIFTVMITIFGYFTYQLFMGLAIIYFAQKNGVNSYGVEYLSKNLTNPEALGISRNLMLTLILGMFVFTFWVFYTAVKKIHRKPFISLLTAYPAIRWKQVFFSFMTWSIVFLFMFFLDYFWVSPKNYVINFNPGKFILLLIICVLFLPVQASFEEIFFRGYLMQGLSLISKNGIFPLLFTSLLFGLAHMSNPEAEEFGAWIMLPYYSLFGFFLGLLALWNNGLELSIGIHVANNIFSALLTTSENTVLKTDALFIVKNENMVNDFILWILGATVTLLIFQYKYRFKEHVSLLR